MSRKPRVIDIDAITASSVSGNTSCQPDQKEAYTYAAPAPPQPLTEEEKGRLALRRAEIAAEVKAKAEAEAAESLRRKAMASIEACAPSADEDEEEVLRKLAAIEGKLDTMQGLFEQRAQGHEDGYQTWLSAERYKKEEAQRIKDAEMARNRNSEALIESERQFVAYLRGLVSGIVDTIHEKFLQELDARERKRISDLDAALQAEAAGRIRAREEKEAASVAQREAYEAALFGSSDPMIADIRKAAHERAQAYRTREAEAETDEEAALEAKLARLTSLRKLR